MTDRILCRPGRTYPFGIQWYVHPGLQRMRSVIQTVLSPAPGVRSTLGCAETVRCRVCTKLVSPLSVAISYLLNSSTRGVVYSPSRAKTHHSGRIATRHALLLISAQCRTSAKVSVICRNYERVGRRETLCQLVNGYPEKG